MHIDRFKTETGEYVDERGCPFDSATDFLRAACDFCGCGDPEAALAFVRDGLYLISLRSTTKYPEYKVLEKNIFGTTGIACFFYYWADCQKLTNHGSCVPDWLEKKGKELLEDLIELGLREGNDQEIASP